MTTHDSNHGPPDGAPDTPTNGGVSRRSFMQTMGVSAAAGAVSTRLEAAAGQDGRAGGPAVIGPDAQMIELTVNGNPTRVEIEPATTLLDALRFHMQMTGSKEICDRGSCGGCSVHVDGKLIASCMMLAVDAIGRDVTTIEGLSGGGGLDPVQEAFIRHDAVQCGYCTPGLVMAATALLNTNKRPTLDEIKSGLSGNLCRCGTYSNVFNAVLDASGQAPIEDTGGG